MASEAWFQSPGQLVATEGLVLPKSRQLARFLLSGVHPNARLLEATSGYGPERFEVIVIEVDVEVGQIPLRDIRAVERIAVAMTPNSSIWCASTPNKMGIP